MGIVSWYRSVVDSKFGKAVSQMLDFGTDASYYYPTTTRPRYEKTESNK